MDFVRPRELLVDPPDPARGVASRALGAETLVPLRMSRTVVRRSAASRLLFADGLPTSCGLYTALRALAVPWGDKFHRLPQVTRNVRATEVDAAEEIARAVQAGHRVIVRRSGTEPVVRVMVEGEDAERWADEIARTLQQV